MDNTLHDEDHDLLTGDDLGFTLAEPPPASTTLSVILIGQQGDAKLGGREDRRGAALDKSAQAIAAAVAGVLHISRDKMANAAFTDKLAVTSCGTYDCNQHVSSKAQVKQRVLVSFAGITQEETIAALASLHNRSNPTVPFTGVSSLALLPDISPSSRASQTSPPTAGTCAPK